MRKKKRRKVPVRKEGPKPVKSGCGVLGPVFDAGPDVFVSEASFCADARSTLPGFENDMTEKHGLDCSEEELVLGDTPPELSVILSGSGAHILKGASRDLNLGTDGCAASGSVQCVGG